MTTVTCGKKREKKEEFENVLDSVYSVYRYVSTAGSSMLNKVRCLFFSYVDMSIIYNNIYTKVDGSCMLRFKQQLETGTCHLVLRSLERQSHTSFRCVGCEASFQELRPGDIGQSRKQSAALVAASVVAALAVAALAAAALAAAASAVAASAVLAAASAVLAAAVLAVLAAVAAPYVPPPWDPVF